MNRRRMIDFLYNNTCLKGLLPLYHRVVGHSIVKKIEKSNKTATLLSANLYYSKVIIEGTYHNNCISIGKNSTLEHSKIRIKGNSNEVAIGENSYINGLELIVEGDENRIYIGKDFFVFGDTRIYIVDGSSLTMGDNCMLSDHIDIRTTDNHSIIDRTTGMRINREEDILIGNHVWIGTGVKILKGSNIADGCIIGAGSVVTRKFKSVHASIAGNPAREIKHNVDWIMERI